MNGPAYALMGFVLLVLVFYVVSIMPIRESGALRWSKGRAAVHTILVLAGLVCVVGIPLLARPGPQPLLSGVVTVVTGALAAAGVRNLVRKNSKGPGADE